MVRPGPAHARLRARHRDPTTELVLSHKHPADRPQVIDGINDMIRRRQAFSVRHRIVDTRGLIHHVIVVGDRFCDDNDEVVGTHGFYIEVTPPPARNREDSISAKVAEIVGRRGVIDRTKGMLMLIYGIDEDAAFTMLKTLSQSKTRSSACSPNASPTTSRRWARRSSRRVRASTGACAPRTCGRPAARRLTANRPD